MTGADVATARAQSEAAQLSLRSKPAFVTVHPVALIAFAQATGSGGRR